MKPCDIDCAVCEGAYNTNCFDPIIENVSKMLARRGDVLATTVIMETDSRGMLHLADFLSEIASVSLFFVPKINIKHFNKVQELNTQAIILHQSTLHHEIKTQILQTPRITVFGIQQFRFDLTAVIPQHVLYTQPRPSDWHKLPKLLLTDPVSRYYNFKLNDIVVVTNPDRTICLRVVV